MRMTFTGVDSRTSIPWMKSFISDKRFPAVAFEFGLLRSAHLDQSPRYITNESIRRISGTIYPDNLAYHLCGRYARMAKKQVDWDELCDINDFSLVGRVQVNAGEYEPAEILTLQRFALHIQKPVIIQWRQAVFTAVSGLHLLQDSSGGQGIEASRWIKPDELNHRARNTSIGYAGGLGPDNIATELPKIIEAASGRPFWIDCESKIRTDDWFDITKVEAMAIAAYQIFKPAAEKGKAEIHQ